MTLQRLSATVFLLIALSLSTSCKRQSPQATEQKANPRHIIGHVITQRTVRVGGTWIAGFQVDVVPEEFVLVQHASCNDSKERPSTENSRGICTFRITKEQSQQFERAMDRFKTYAKPLQDFSFDDRDVRPDGKPCKNYVFDTTGVALTWTGTDGIKLANFYAGCDEKEFGEFYKSVLRVTDPLPIQQIIGKH